MNRSEFKSLFLSQSYIDSWESYKKSLTSRKAQLWDYVILTAASEDQAEIFREEIKARLDGGYLPAKTEYLVVSDPGGERVGSGGATLNVLRILMEREGGFDRKRILLIHSGGDSKRIPQYSICGKLFSPVPRELPNGQPSTLFDEIIISMSAMPGRIEEGMLVLSGDVFVLFNPLQIDAQIHGAAAISVKTDVGTGSEHGVFLNDGKGYVSGFLHKQTPQMLNALGAVDPHDKVDIDTGMVLFDVGILNALYRLISDDTENGPELNCEKFNELVNSTCRVSFYGDFLYTLAKDSTLDEYYKQQAEGELCDELMRCRTQIWQALRGFEFKLLSVSPAHFFHFGTSREILDLETKDIEGFKPLGWTKCVNSYCPDTDAPVYHSVVDEGMVPPDSFIEYSHIHSGVRVGHGCIVSGVDISEAVIPDDTVVHGVVLKDGGFVARVYNIDANPKDNVVYQGAETPLWDVPMFPVCSTMDEAVSASLKELSKVSQGAGEDKAGSRKLSLKESFLQADNRALIEYKKKLADRIVFAKIKQNINLGKPESVSMELFERVPLSERLCRYLIESADKADFSDKIRILHLLSAVMEKQNIKFDNTDAETVADMCYDAIKESIVSDTSGCIPADTRYVFVKDEVKTNLPLRVNWGGGWTDTPPQCMEQGGLVINAAITLNNKYPVHAIVMKAEEKGIFFESSDLDVKGRASSVDDIRDCRNPGDFFSLHKAALLATGIIPSEGEMSIESVCDRIGGGLYLCTSVDGIPKGSGLGTSSILAAATVKALFEAFGVNVSAENINNIVLAMEQLMSTGGGWQDQAGALFPGIKRLTSRPGFTQRIQVEEIELSSQMKKEFSERFALIYTGQRRLARNLLRDVIGSYIARRTESVEALHEMKMISEQMQFALENDKFDSFTALLNRHWEVSKKLDSGCTNTCIESIFDACEDLISGRFIAGAGGGGFLQVFLKKGISKQDLSDRIEDIFGDSGVCVWDPQILW